MDDLLKELAEAISELNPSSEQSKVLAEIMQRIRDRYGYVVWELTFEDRNDV